MERKRIKILITRQIPPIGIDLLQEHFDVSIADDSADHSGKGLIEQLPYIDGLLCLLSERIDRQVIDAGNNLKVISNYAVGYDNIDVTHATRKGIAVTNTPGVLTDATADFTWTLILGVCRRVHTADRLVRAGKFHGWNPLLLRGADLHGKTLGIIGAGRIGTAVAERSAGWKMKILYYDRSINRQLETQFQAHKTPLPELLKESDIITIHLPLTADTTHLIGIEELRLMKSSAYLINTARGPIIDEQALVEVLKHQEIAGAALDVFENEPSLAPGVTELDNVLLAPHIASATYSTRDKMAEIAAINIINIFQGKPPLSIVNPEVLSHIDDQKN